MEYPSSPTLTAELKVALRRLETYSKDTFKKQKKSPLKKTISLFKSLIFDKKRQQIEVLQAVDTIHRERLYIQKLKDGNKSERDLAKALTNAIEAYNRSQEFDASLSSNLNNGVSKFFLKLNHPISQYLPKIDLPQEKSLKLHYSDISCHINLKQKTAPLIQSCPSIPLSKQTAELFQMKALALLERYGIASNPEARDLVKNSPIIATIENDASTCTLAQQLLLFPGQTIIIMGSSELDAKTQTIHKLFPKTFHVSLESTQTGFPHPSQRSGWALANQLLPESPQRPDLLNLLSHFFQRKKQVASALLPHGEFLDKAKKLLKLKKIVWNINKQELIELHREFVLTLVKNSETEFSEIISTVLDFYAELHNQSDPFEFLSNTHSIMRDLFITKPHKILLESILTKTSKIFPDNILRSKLEILDDIFAKELTNSLNESLQYCCEKEQLKWKYIKQVGIVLGNAAKQIILQYLSEDLHYSPTKLNSFECKIQTLAYLEVEDFIEELQSEMSNDEQQNFQALFLKIRTNILNEIAILDGFNSFQLSEELEHYFLLRHQSFQANKIQ